MQGPTGPGYQGQSTRPTMYFRLNRGYGRENPFRDVAANNSWPEMRTKKPCMLRIGRSAQDSTVATAPAGRSLGTRG